MYFEYVGPVPDTQSNKELLLLQARTTDHLRASWFLLTYVPGRRGPRPSSAVLPRSVGLSVRSEGAREHRPAGATPRSTTTQSRHPTVHRVAPSLVVCVRQTHHKYTTEAGGQTRVWKVRSQRSLGERERPEGVRWYAWHRHAALSPHGSTFSQHGRRCVRYGGLYKAHIHDIQSSHVHR